MIFNFDIMRALVGDNLLSYLGFSYGTYLGATYADLFNYLTACFRFSPYYHFRNFCLDVALQIPLNRPCTVSGNICFVCNVIFSFIRKNEFDLDYPYARDIGRQTVSLPLSAKLLR